MELLLSSLVGERRSEPSATHPIDFYLNNVADKRDRTAVIDVLAEDVKQTFLDRTCFFSTSDN